MAGAVLATLVACWCMLVTSSAHVHRRSLDASEALLHMNDFYLPRSVVPRSYRLQVVPNLDTGDFHGRVWVNVSCIEPTDSITLHAHENLNTTSSRLSVRQLPRDSDSGETKDIVVSSTKKNFAKQWYIIMLGDRLQKGFDYELHVAFSGKLNDARSEAFFRGSYVDSRSKESSWYAGTAMETTKARQVFPCFDEPALKAHFEISVGARRRYHVWSTMPLKDTQDMSDQPGWLWHHFPATPLMSTFSVGVFVSDFHYATVMMPSGGYLRLSSRPELLDHLEKINKVSTEAFNFAEEYLNISYPLEKLDVIVLPKNSSDYSSDSWGLVMLKESDMPFWKNKTYIVASSVLTQWLGQLATPYWWSSVDLYSALVRHLAEQFLVQKLNMTIAEIDDNLGIYPKANSVEGHDKSVRALRLLRLLNYTLTESTFRQAIRVFLEDRQYKTFTEHNLWTALTAQAREDNTLPDDVNVEEIAQSWLGKERLPVITVTRSYEENSATFQQHVFIRERPHNIPGKDRMLWYIPVTYISEDNMNASDVRPVAWLRNQKQVTIEDLPAADNFIVVDPHEIGTVIVNYDSRNWELLSQALEDGVLCAQARAKLLHDSWNLALSGELDFATALNLTLFLRKEKSLQVWERAFTMIDHLRSYLSGTDVQALYDEYAKRLADDCLSVLGPAGQTEDPETTSVRQNVQTFRFRLSDQQFDALLDKQFDAWAKTTDAFEYVKDEEGIEKTMPPGSVAKFQFSLEFVVNIMSYQSLVEEASMILQDMSKYAAMNAEKTESLLKMVLLEDHPDIPASVPRACVRGLSSYYNGSLATFHFLQEHWDDLRDRLESNMELWKQLMSTATAKFITQEDLDMFSEFYLEKRGHFGNAELLVEKELERMREDAAWTKDNVPVIHRWLENFLEKSMSLGSQTSSEM